MFNFVNVTNGSKEHRIVHVVKNSIFSDRPMQSNFSPLLMSPTDQKNTIVRNFFVYRQSMSAFVSITHKMAHSSMSHYTPV